MEMQLESMRQTESKLRDPLVGVTTSVPKMPHSHRTTRIFEEWGKKCIYSSNFGCYL